MKKITVTQQERDTLIWMSTVAGATKKKLAQDYGLTMREVSAILRGKKPAK